MKAVRANLRPSSKQLEKPPVPSAPKAPTSECEAGFLPKDLLFFQKLPRRASIPSFDLPEKYGIQASLPSRVRDDDEGLPFLLGSGASCTVLQHETGSDTQSVVPAGTIVALKKYLINKPLQSRARNNNRKSLQMIWHDMRIHCHPYFRSHENFCRLLYLGWEYGSLVPVLALEIAEFGTLQNVMQSERKMSVLQTCNVCLDIAVGLHALHAFGFVHGDLKPGNILLQTHATRQVVAKLTDFAGVINSKETSASSIPPFVTPSWLAPEVLTGASRVEWQKVDVYAFGLILAQIWCHVDLDLLDCFLEARIPKQCPARHRKDFILYYKICPQNLPESALSQCLHALKNADLENHGLLHRPFVAMIRQSVLREPMARAGMNQILGYSADLASYCSRPWSVDETVQYDHSCVSDLASSESDWLVFSDTFEQRDTEHQCLTLEYMLNLAGEPVLQRSRLQYGQEEDLTDPAALARHLLANYDILESVPDGEYYWRSIHFQIAICYFRGFGTTINDERGLHFLASSALGGVRRAMFMFNSFERSSSVRMKEDLPRRLFLLLGYFENCSEAADLLRSCYPDTFAAAQILHAGCWSFGPGTLVSSMWSIEKQHEAQKQVWEARSTLMGRLTRICEFGADEDQWLSILADRTDSDVGKIMFAVALERENLQLVTSLLKSGCDAHVLNPDAGLSPLHILAFIEDACAAELAKVLVDSGVRLDADGVEPWSDCKNRISLGRSSPTIWAVVKNRPLLFEALLDIHLAKNITIPGIHAYALAATIVRYRRPQMLKALLARQILNREELKKADFLLYALNKGLTHNLDHDLIGLRWGLESSFKVGQQAILRLLLEHDADPLGPRPPRNTVLERCILVGAGPSLEIFSDHLRQKGDNLENLLGNTGVYSYLGPWKFHSALMASLVARDGSAFRWLLETFPGSINDRSMWGITPLRRAAENRHLFWAVELLLQKGADILCYDDMGFSPLATALAMGNMDIAQTLVQHARSQGVLRALLGPNPVNGYNLLGVLLKTFSSGWKRRLDVSSFEYLWKLGGAVFDVHGEDETVWRIFFRKGRSTRVDHQAADIRLLRFLLRPEVFGGLVDSSDWTGRTPLHYACYRGNLDAVVLLLDSGASIDTLSKPGIREATSLKGSLTSLDFALTAYLNGAPKEVRAGGAVEVSQWQQRMKSIITELVNRGGNCGPNRGVAHQMYAEKIAHPNEWKNVYVGFEDPKGDETWRAEWPKPLPVCPTGMSPMQEQAMMIGKVFNPDTDEVEPQYEPLIIYRDRKGRKHKLTRTALQIVGPFLDESSDESDDAEMEAFQCDLTRIKGYIRKYVSAKADAERTQETELVDVQAMLGGIRLGNDKIGATAWIET